MNVLVWYDDCDTFDYEYDPFRSDVILTFDKDTLKVNKGDRLNRYSIE